MPPNIRGWPGGRMWINTSTLFHRYNACVNVTGSAAAAVDFRPDASASPQQIVQYWIDRLISRPIAQDKKRVLLEALGQRTGSDAQRRVVQLIVSMPEYQLC